MPSQYLILRGVTLLLLAAVMAMITGTSSAQRREARRRDASPPQETIVIDSIGDLDTNTRFKLPGSWGSPLDERNSTGAEFTLTQTTTITEIGAYVESCTGMVRGQYLEPCDPVPPISVNIHPQLHNKPDLATVIASYTLSNDNDRTLISYESVKVELTLEPGTYYAIFNNTYKYGLLMAGASHPHEYTCKSITEATVRTDPDANFTSTQHIAVRILKKPWDTWATKEKKDHPKLADPSLRGTPGGTPWGSIRAGKTIQEGTDRANRESPSGLALEISWDGKGQIFDEVPPAGASPGSASLAAAMVSTYKGRDSQLNLRYGREGAAVRVTIALSYSGPGLGVQTNEAERHVIHPLKTHSELKVSHLLQLDQKIEVNDFSEYGLKPFAIRIVRIKHVDPPLPSFSSCTDAIQLVSVERLEGEFPSFRFTVRNVGSSRINYLSGEANPRGTLAFAAERPVAKAGEQFTIEVRSGFHGRLIDDIYHPDTIASFKVTCAVFDDGEFVCDRGQAFDVLQGATCNRLTMERVVELLNERLESGATDLGELRSKVLAVCQHVGVDEMRELIARFPEYAQNPEKTSCAQYSDSIANGLVGRIDAFVRDHSQSATKEQTIDLLKSLREPYLKALSRWKPRS